MHVVTSQGNVGYQREQEARSLRKSVGASKGYREHKDGTKATYETTVFSKSKEEEEYEEELEYHNALALQWT